MKLIRDDQNCIRTLGAMLDGEERVCETLELPWLNNQRGVSCIPEGIYLCEAAMSPSRGYVVYWIRDVPGRKDCQIHIANFTKDLRGCVGVGMERGMNQVVHSKIAFDKFMKRMGGGPFMLTVTCDGKLGANVV